MFYPNDPRSRGWRVEGRLHKLFKGVVKHELLRQDYTVYMEPRAPPVKRLEWGPYRPDVLGIASDHAVFKVALAECETAPSRSRVRAKTATIRQTLTLQKQLYERHVIRPLLIIPPRKLDRINSSAIRRFWEIWIVSRRGTLAHKIPRTAKT